MGLATVTYDDVRNVRRSNVVLGVVGVFAALVALVFVAEADIYADPYRTLYDVSLLVALALPLFLAPLTYLSIAGDREGGSIKFTLGLPNSRAAYVLGKFVSRASIAVAAAVVATVVGFVVAFATFENAPDLGRFAAFGFVSALYAVGVTGLFVAISATTTTRSRAMFGVIGAYFLLVPFWFGFLPVINLETIVDFATSTLGVTLSDSTRELIGTISPATAYLQATELVYADAFTTYPSIARSFQPDSSALPHQVWFTSLVMLAWGAVALAVGYVRFRVSELG